MRWNINKISNKLIELDELNLYQSIESNSIENRSTFSDLVNHSCNSICSKAPFYNINEEGQQRLSTVYRCVQLISDQVQQLQVIPYHVWDNKKTIQYGSNVYSLFNLKMNNRNTKFMFIKQLVESMLLKGNAYAYIKRDRDGKPVEMVYIPSDYVLPVYSPIEFNEPVLYKVMGYDRLVEHTDMIHIVNRYANNDNVLGISTIKYQALALNISLNSDENANNFFNGASNVKGFIKIPGNLTNEQKEDLLNSIQQLQNNNQISILERGQEYQQVTISPDDAQLIETRQFNTLQLQNFFGVPASKLNSKDGTTYNNAEMDQISFLTDTIQPLLYKFEDEFEKKLLSDTERTYTEIKFKIDDILRTDLKTKVESYRTLFNMGVMSQNDIRFALDMSPIDNGSNYFTQVNMQTLDKFENQNNIQNNAQNQ